MMVKSRGRGEVIRLVRLNLSMVAQAERDRSMMREKRRDREANECNSDRYTDTDLYFGSIQPYLFRNSYELHHILTDSDGTGAVTVGLLDAAGGGGTLASGLGGELLAGSLASGGLAGGLLRTGHCVRCVVL